MRKIFSFFAALLVAVAVNAQTDFAAPGYYCAADDAVLSGGSSSSFYLDQNADPHHVAWSDVSTSANAVATWTINASRGCYVSVALDLGPVIGSNKHIFEVKMYDANNNLKGTIVEGTAEVADANMLKPLEGTILLPTAGTYTLELRNNRNWGKGTIKNVILTYAADAPSEMVEVSGIELNKTELTLELEEVELLSATVSPDNATDPSVTWVSDNPEVATVSENGFINAIATGTATITAKAGEKSATCALTVSEPTVPSADFAEPCVLSGKKAHLEGAIWKNEAYKLYGDGGHNKNYGTASWTINVTKACIVTGALDGVEGGHTFGVDVYDANETLVGSLEQPEGKTWSAGEIALDGSITFAAVGNYTIKLRNTQEWSSGKVAGITLTYSADISEPEPEPLTLYLKLSEGDGNWAGWPAKYAIYYFNDATNGWSDFMTAVEGEQNVYVGTIPAEYTNDKIIFVRLNGETTEANWDNKWSQTVNLEIPEGKDFFTVTSGGTGSECNGVWSKYGEEYVPALANGFYLVGTFGGVEAWNYEALSAAKQFKENEENAGEYKLEYTLAAGDKFKVVYVENDAIKTWYPDGSDNDYVVDAAHAGEKTIYFKPEYQTDWNGYVYIEANAEPQPTALTNTTSETKAVKTLKNGILVIEKAGVKYNVLGQTVR